MRRRLAREESGFTLIEMLVAISLSMVVLLAVVNLLDSSGRAASNVTDRVDATQRGRSALEQITQRLRSQVCPTDTVAPVLYADDNRVTFYADLPNANPTFVPEVRSIYYRTGTNASTDPSALREDVYRYVTEAQATATPPTLLPTTAQIADFSLASPTATPSETRAFIENVAPLSGKPVFTYYGFNTDNPGLPNLKLEPPAGGQLTAAQRADVVRITVAFDSRPQRGDVQNGQTRRVRDALDTRFENEVFVRSADPTQSNRDPAPCV